MKETLAMNKIWMVVGLTVALAGCAQKASLEIPTGSDVTVQKKDGVSVTGRLVEVGDRQVVIEGRDGVKLQVPRSEIASVRATPKAPDAARAEPTSAGAVPTSGTAADATTASNPIKKLFERKPEYREVTLPAGTVLPLEMTSRVDSDRSHVEDQVHATLRRALVVDGVEAFPAGTAVLGHVTNAKESAKVKGRASIGFRFTQIDLPGGNGHESISTATVSRVAPGTKKKDAARVGVGAGAGAIVGGILGGKSGAAKGAAVGGGAGTAVVLTTRGNEIGIAAGTPISVKLTAPLTVRVPMK
jgi:hypothetical protein